MQQAISAVCGRPWGGRGGVTHPLLSKLEECIFGIIQLAQLYAAHGKEVAALMAGHACRGRRGTLVGGG